MIPRVESVRILGLILIEKGSNNQTIARIKAKMEKMLRLTTRVSNRIEGLSESNILRLYDAFLMSHKNYVASALNWCRSEEDKIDALMRESIKLILGIPTSTEKLLQ